jgi:DNA-binding winged helix-turn-helix (wHTH) protein/TolB-like protein
MRYRFGTFEFDDRTGLLTRGDRLIALEPQPARALGLLLAHAGELVARDDLRAHLWGDETHVDFDRGLAYCIGQLRAALGDSADNPRFVQTLPRRGFKFIAPVEAIGKEASGPAESPGDMAPAGTAPRRPTHWAMPAAAVVLLVVLGAASWLSSRNRTPSMPARPIVAVAVFENETGDSAYERGVAALSDAIVERLTALGPERLGVNGNASILRRPRDARDTNAVARETGATFLVAGQLQTRDGKLSLLMHMIRLDDGTHVWVQRIARPLGDRLETLDAEVAGQIEAAVRDIVLSGNAGRASWHPALWRQLAQTPPVSS